MLAKITLGISRNKRKFKQNTSNTERVLCSCLSNDSEKDKNVCDSDKQPRDMEPIDWQAERRWAEASARWEMRVLPG